MVRGISGTSAPLNAMFNNLDFQSALQFTKSAANLSDRVLEQH